MSDTPVLPLSPSQAGELLQVLEAVRPPDAATNGPVGPVVERLVVALVRILRAEDDDLGQTAKQTRKGARRRAVRGGFVTGAFGVVGAAPREAVELVEQARAAVDVADEVAPGRSDTVLAADLLVVWGLVDDVTAARAFTDESSPESLLGGLLREQHGRLRELVPDEWTVRSTLRFMWEARALRDVVGVVDDLRGGFIQAVPVIGAVPGAWNAGRGMRRFQKDLREHLGVHP
jgi:hypothetical protein